jgi:hypothetical protein
MKRLETTERTGKFDVLLGREDKGSEVFLPEEGRFLNELLLGSTGAGVTSFAALPRIRQDIQKLAQGYPVGLFVLSDKEELIQDVLTMGSEEGIRADQIHVLRVVKEEIRLEVITKTMESGGVVLAYASEEMDTFFRSAFIHFFMDILSRCTFNRPSGTRIPIFVTIDSIEAMGTEAFIRILRQGRSYRVGLSVVLKTLKDFPTNKSRSILDNMRNISSFQLDGADDQGVISDYLSLESPRYIDSLGGRQFYCRYVTHEGSLSKPVILTA